jgi:protease-4
MAILKKDNSDEKVVSKFAEAALAEQKRSRRWGIFFKLLTFGYLIALLFMFGQSSPHSPAHSGDFTAFISLNGIIGDQMEVNAKDFKLSMKNAYDDPGTKGVILAINSPGGSPVQSGIINDEIKKYRQLRPDIPVYAVVEDICASGAYYIAVAADQIFVDKASIVGSIGVRLDQFGLDKAIKHLNIERRLITAGENKAILDPFLPFNPEHKKHLENLLAEVHRQFINVVKEGRAGKLSNNNDIFSGLFWNGEGAIHLGLADQLGNIDYVAKEVVGFEELVDFTTYESFADRFAKQLGAGIGAAFENTILKSINNNYQLN